MISLIPKTCHLSATATDGHGEVVERYLLTADDIILTPMSNAGHKSDGSIVSRRSSPGEGQVTQTNRSAFVRNTLKDKVDV